MKEIGQVESDRLLIHGYTYSKVAWASSPLAQTKDRKGLGSAALQKWGKYYYTFICCFNLPKILPRRAFRSSDSTRHRQYARHLNGIHSGFQQLSEKMSACSKK